MKTKLLSFVLCVAVLGGVWLLLKQTAKKTEITADTIHSNNDENVLPSTGEQGETEVSDAYVAQTARDVENFMTQLAYSSVEDPDAVIIDLTERLERSRQYLKDVKADYHGAGYFLTVANFLEDLSANPFTDNTSFGVRVNEALTQLSNAMPQDAAPEGLAYPAFDTNVNGTTTLAMLALYQKQQQKSGNIILTFGGNLTMGDTLLGVDKADSFKTRQSQSSYSYPLYRLAAVLQNDTASFVNLETPLTDSASDAVAVSGSKKGSAAYAKLLSDAGVDIVSVANEHIKDYKDKGYSDTLKALKDANVEYTENGLILYRKTSAGTVAFISYNIINQTGKNVNLTAAPNTDIPRARENGAQIVIVHFNWVNSDGTEWDPSMSQIYTARNAVDQGADLVIGTNPSFMQSLVRYNGVCMVFSPGDLFKNDGEGKTAFLFQQSFSIQDGAVNRGEIRVFPICTAGGDDATPYLTLDATAATSFLSTIQQYSKPVKGGVGRNDSFTLGELHVVSVTK